MPPRKRTEGPGSGSKSKRAKGQGPGKSRRSSSRKDDLSTVAAATAYADVLDSTCLLCQGYEEEHLMLLCDQCNGAHHTYCLGLAGLPDEDIWICPKCLSPPQPPPQPPLPQPRSQFSTASHNHYQHGHNRPNDDDDDDDNDDDDDGPTYMPSLSYSHRHYPNRQQQHSLSSSQNHYLYHPPSSSSSSSTSSSFHLSLHPPSAVSLSQLSVKETIEGPLSDHSAVFPAYSPPRMTTYPSSSSSSSSSLSATPAPLTTTMAMMPTSALPLPLGHIVPQSILAVVNDDVDDHHDSYIITTAAARLPTSTLPASFLSIAPSSLLAMGLLSSSSSASSSSTNTMSASLGMVPGSLSQDLPLSAIHGPSQLSVINGPSQLSAIDGPSQLSAFDGPSQLSANEARYQQQQRQVQSHYEQPQQQQQQPVPSPSTPIAMQKIKSEPSRARARRQQQRLSPSPSSSSSSLLLPSLAAAPVAPYSNRVDSMSPALYQNTPPPQLSSSSSSSSFSSSSSSSSFSSSSSSSSSSFSSVSSGVKSFSSSEFAAAMSRIFPWYKQLAVDQALMNTANEPPKMEETKKSVHIAAATAVANGQATLKPLLQEASALPECTVSYDEGSIEYIRTILATNLVEKTRPLRPPPPPPPPPPLSTSTSTSSLRQVTANDNENHIIPAVGAASTAASAAASTAEEAAVKEEGCGILSRMTQAQRDEYAVLAQVQLSPSPSPSPSTSDSATTTTSNIINNRSSHVLRHQPKYGMHGFNLSTNGSIGNTGSSSLDLECVATGAMELNSVWAHPRFICGNIPFKGETDAVKSTFCPECWCVVCDVRASECPLWTSRHFRADDSTWWLEERQRMRSAEQALEKTWGQQLASLQDLHNKATSMGTNTLEYTPLYLEYTKLYDKAKPLSTAEGRRRSAALAAQSFMMPPNGKKDKAAEALCGPKQLTLAGFFVKKVTKQPNPP